VDGVGYDVLGIGGACTNRRNDGLGCGAIYGCYPRQYHWAKINIQHQRIRVFSLVQQALIVFLLLFFKQLMVLWVSGLAGQAPSISTYFLPTLAGAMIWPWLFLLLRALRRRFTASRRF